MKCVVCYKEAEISANGWTFCLKHYKGFRNYPDNDPEGYIRYCEKYGKKEKKA